MIGFHMQSAVRDWPNAVKLLPAGTWCKSLNDQHLCRDLKAVNPGVKVVFRYEFNQHQHLQGDFHDLARDFFSRFIDGTFWEQELYRYMDAIEEWNEYLANSQTFSVRNFIPWLKDKVKNIVFSERAQWLAWCKAVNEVWTNEYRYNPAFEGKLSHIRLVSCNTAIGNDIPLEFARVVQEHDGILGYHNYTNVYRKSIVGSDREFYSGRWMGMDDQYRQAGVLVDWLFTEGGPTCMGTFDGQHYAGVTEGWRHEATYDEDLQAYIDGTIVYQLDLMADWNAQHGDRCLGGVLFTTESKQESIWKRFHLFTPQMIPIAEKVASHDPSPPPPPPPDDWQARAWAKSVEMQISNGIMLNPDAGIQRRIFADGNMNPGAFVPVQNEFSFEGRTFQAAETLDGSKPRRLYWWTAVDGVHYFENPT